MALICPACKRRYDGDHVFCEDCGNSLLPRRFRWRKWALLGLAAACAIAGLWIGLALIENDVRNNVSVGVEGYSLDADMRVLRVPLVIRNNSSVSLRLDAITCRASVFGVTARCLESDLPMDIRRGDVATATLRVAISASPHGSAGSSVEVPQVTLHAWGIPIQYQVTPSNLLTVSNMEIDNILNPARQKDPEPEHSNCCDPRRPAHKKRGTGEAVGVFHEEKDSAGNGVKEARDLARNAVSKVKDMSQMRGNP
jgi:hypothetical protein